MTATQTVPETGTKTTWKIDPSHTIVEFSAKHLMISTVKGRITDIEGTIVADEDELANSSVDVTLKAALHAEQFPVITFRSTKIEGDREDFSLTGDLTIREVTKPIMLKVTFEGQTKDPWGGERIGFSASGKIDRRDFGLTWNQLLETGGAVVGNEIKIAVEVEAIKA